MPSHTDDERRKNRTRGITPANEAQGRQNVADLEAHRATTMPEDPGYREQISQSPGQAQFRTDVSRPVDGLLEPSFTNFNPAVQPPGLGPQTPALPAGTGPQFPPPPDSNDPLSNMFRQAGRESRASFELPQPGIAPPAPAIPTGLSSPPSGTSDSFWGRKTVGVGPFNLPVPSPEELVFSEFPMEAPQGSAIPAQQQAAQQFAQRGLFLNQFPQQVEMATEALRQQNDAAGLLNPKLQNRTREFANSLLDTYAQDADPSNPAAFRLAAHKIEQALTDNGAFPPATTQEEIERRLVMIQHKMLERSLGDVGQARNGIANAGLASAEELRAVEARERAAGIYRPQAGPAEGELGLQGAFINRMLKQHQSNETQGIGAWDPSNPMQNSRVMTAMQGQNVPGNTAQTRVQDAVSKTKWEDEERRMRAAATRGANARIGARTEFVADALANAETPEQVAKLIKLFNEAGVTLTEEQRQGLNDKATAGLGPKEGEAPAVLPPEQRWITRNGKNFVIEGIDPETGEKHRIGLPIEDKLPPGYVYIPKTANA